MEKTTTTKPKCLPTTTSLYTDDVHTPRILYTVKIQFRCGRHEPEEKRKNAETGWYRKSSSYVFTLPQLEITMFNTIIQKDNPHIYFIGFVK